MNENFCILPWLHLHTFPNGNALVCCNWDQQNPVGKLSENNIEEIATSETLNSIRRDMMAGEKITGCYKCKQVELTGSESDRIKFNTMFSEKIDSYLNLTYTDGSLDYDFKLKFMNIRYSNLCNYACRSCGPFHSSLWAQEKNKEAKPTVITNDVPNYLDEIYYYLPDVEYINFAGGESILISEHWEVLDKLIQLNKTDVHITYVTNLSKLRYQDKNIVEYIEKFRNFKLIASIDASHDRAEIYRHGTNWQTIVSNLQILKDANVELSITCTVGAMNVWHVPDLHEFLTTNNFVCSQNFRLQILVESSFLSTKILPKNYKDIVTEKILKHVEGLRDRNLYYDNWIELINFMNSEDHSHLLPRFKMYTRQLDHIRKQNTLDAFPELKGIV